MQDYTTCLLGVSGEDKLTYVDIFYSFSNVMIIVPTVVKVLVKNFSSDLIEANDIKLETSNDAYNLPLDILKSTEEKIIIDGSLNDIAIWSLVHQTFIPSVMSGFYADSILDFIDKYLMDERDENILPISRLLILDKEIRKIKPDLSSYFALEFIHDPKDHLRIIEQFNAGNGTVQAYKYDNNDIHEMFILNSGYYLEQLKKQLNNK